MVFSEDMEHSQRMRELSIFHTTESESAWHLLPSRGKAKAVDLLWGVMRKLRGMRWATWQ